MGITNFSKFLSRRAANCYAEVPLDFFRNKRVAIDMHGYIHQIMFGAMANKVERLTEIARPEMFEVEKKTLDILFNRLTIMLYAGITPVCVFDSKPHELKSTTNMKRKEYKMKNIMKLEELERRQYSTQTGLSEWKQYMKRTVEPTRDFIDEMKYILESNGFPVLTASDYLTGTGDGEALCASLCMEGNDLCAAAMTEDSDFHVYGGNVAITGIIKKNSGYYAKTRSLENILLETGLTFPQFRDLCIMMGTDFNKNIPRIGEVKSWDLIIKHGSVENISKTLDTSILNYDTVKNIFESSIVRLPLNEQDVSFNSATFREQSRSVMSQYGLEFHTDCISILFEEDKPETL